MRRMKKGIALFLATVMLLMTVLPTMAAGAKSGFDKVIVSDFDVFDADIRDVFRSIAEIGDVNVLFDPSVSGKLTTKLRQGLTVREAIDMLAQTYGYSRRWVDKSKTVLIGKEESFAKYDTLESRVYKLQHSEAKKVAESLANSIKKEQIGIDERTNQLVIKASAFEHDNIAEIVANLDREMPQINIEARVEEITESASETLGIGWTFGTGNKNIFGDTSSPNLALPFTASLEAEEGKGNARMLAKPNISTLDSQEGTIFIGERYPLVTTEQSDGEWSTEVEYIEFGTKLVVTPRINEDGLITLTINTYVSSVSEWKTINTASVYMETPIIATREANTVVRLADGETFALSGLDMIEETDSDSGVPFLARIPILGKLFGQSVKRNEDTKLVIFITPRIVNKDRLDAQKAKALEEAKAKEAAKAKAEAEAIVAAEPVVAAEVATPVVAEPIVTTPVVEEAKVAEAAPVAEEKIELPDYRANYTAQSGDTAATIASKYGIDEAYVTAANDSIVAGEVVKVPVPADHLYTLKAKETLWRLSKRYDTTVEDLMALNGLKNHTDLSIGQELVLPCAASDIANANF